MFSRAREASADQNLYVRGPLSETVANKRRKRYYLRPVRTTPSLALDTLNTLTVITTNVYGNADGAYRVISMDGTWTIDGLTVGEGPIVFGFAHGDYTVVEIKEALEGATSISIGNKVELERSRRWVRRVGVFSGENVSEAFNDGRQWKTRLNWTIPIGTNLNMFAYNDTEANLTTGARVKFNGTGWVKDY